MNLGFSCPAKKVQEVMDNEQKKVRKTSSKVQ